MKTVSIILMAASLLMAGTTNVRIYHQAVASPASVLPKQIGVNTTADANLGYKMWFGKDADGNLTYFISKSKPALFTSVRQDSSFSIRDTAKSYKGDTGTIGGLRATRFYYGTEVGTSSRNDSIFSIRDTSKIMKADSGFFSKLVTIKFSADTITANKDFIFPIRWDDMDQFALGAAKSVGATGFPALTSTGNGFSQYLMGLSDSAQGIIEHGHRFIEGDTDHIHVHYLTGAKDAGATFVNWSIHYLARNIGDTITYTGTITKQDTIAANTLALTHKIFEIGEIPMPLIKIGSIRIMMVKRIAASPATNPSVSPYILQVGIHRKVNSIGSHEELVK